MTSKRAKSISAGRKGLDFGTVRPRVQIPGPRPFLYSNRRFPAVVQSLRIAAGSQFPTEHRKPRRRNGVVVGQCEITALHLVATQRP